MTKLIAILNVVAWSGFWAFGYIAVTTEVQNGTQMMVAALLAFAGAVMGVFAYLWLVRHCERTGYAQAPRRAFPNSDNPTGGTL